MASPRPLDLVNVLEQLPPDVVGTMVLGQLDGDDIRRFKLVAPSTLALVRRTSRVLHLGRSNGQDEFPSRLELETQASIFEKYQACMELQLDLATIAGFVSPMQVGACATRDPGPGPGNVTLNAHAPSYCAWIRMDLSVSMCAFGSLRYQVLLPTRSPPHLMSSQPRCH